MMQVICLARSSCFVLALLLTSSALADYGPDCVNDYGDPASLVIEGCKTFSPELIRNALVGEIDVAAAAHPAAPRTVYCTTLCDKVTAGYQRAGFANPNVMVKIDEKTDKVHILIDEGPRYLAGDIIVKGHQDIVASEVSKHLNSPSTPANARRRLVEVPEGAPKIKWVNQQGDQVKPWSPMWERGKPIFFDPLGEKELHKAVKRALADQGYLPEFRVTIKPQPDNETASLLIEIVDEGPKVVLDNVTISGNARHSREEILDYLGLKQGMPYVTDWPVELEYRLWKSGRFIESWVTLNEPSEHDRRASLHIELVESEWAPKLGEPLLEEQEILLKVRDQLICPECWPGDLVCHADLETGGMDFVISPNRGVVGSARWTSPPKEGWPEQFEGTFVFTDRHLGFFCAKPFRAGFAVARTEPLPWQVHASIKSRLINEPDNSDGQRCLGLGVGVKSLDEDKAPRPFQLELDIAPALLVAAPVIETDTETSIEKGILTIRSTKERWRVEAATGRLLEFTVFPMEHPDDIIHVLFEKGAFQKRVDQIQATSGDYPNVVDGDTFLTSWMSLVFSDEVLDSMKTDEESRRWLRLARILQQKGVFEGDQRLTDILNQCKFWKKPEDNDFEIPPIPSSPYDAQPADGYWVAARIALSAIEKIFARNTWPWTFSRELALLVAQKSQYTNRTMFELWNSSETGPLFYLTAATSLHLSNYEEQAQAFARRGLTKLSMADFQKDCRALLNQEAVLGHCALRLTDAVRKLTPEEIDQILGPSAPDSSFLAKFIASLREHPEKPADEAMCEALAIAWESALRDKVEERLTNLCNPDHEESTPPF